MSQLTDLRLMDTALALARTGLGTTAPNPSVGCVLVNAGEIVGIGVTASGGRPHAEKRALDMAGEAAHGATAYVTLEPCAHIGQTPPCADALIYAGIVRAVVACIDPDERTAGQGLDRIRAAGIIVDTGVRQAEAEALHAGFFHRVIRGWPLVTIDANASGYDLSLEIIDEADVLTALQTLAKQGINSLRLVPGSPAATAVIKVGLVDADATKINTPR